MSTPSAVDSVGAARILQEAPRVVVVTHIRPDADAIGSATAWRARCAAWAKR
ncbi:hypothetical protein [Corynebacterium pilosum]|uniref:hypothetical protein n=1 Tax=Corynebacterium pilosum TaxID=35756 RepID=UPI000AF21955